MKPMIWFLLLLALASCSPAATATPIPTIPLDPADTSAPNQVLASGVVVPAQQSHLSFVISGLIADVPVEEGDLVQAGQPLAQLDTTELALSVTAAESALFSAQVDADLQRIRNRQFRNGRIVYLSGPREQILAADAKVEQRQAALDTAQASLAQATLTAPFDGIVVSIDASPGEFVQPAQQILLVADLRSLQIETTDLSEKDVASVQVGQPALVFIEALNAEFPAEVSNISPISGTIGGDVVFKVTLQLDRQPANLLWGMSTDVEIEVQ